MGISPFDATDTSNYEIEYIPQRLAALEICVHACYLALCGNLEEYGEEVPVVQRTSPFGPKPVCSLRQFVSIAIDAGLVANRTLLNFVGIKLEMVR